MTREAPRHLFVYGTLMRGSRSPYAKLLQARAHFVGEASAPGRLYDLGRFPGAVFDARCRGRVHGELFRLHGAALLVALDAYEGCGGLGTKPDLFYRDIVEAQLACGGRLAAWTYSFAGHVAWPPVTASGRFALR